VSVRNTKAVEIRFLMISVLDSSLQLVQLESEEVIISVLGHKNE
tara:strand:- start:324 stop:455 length:132 start_codon:yes stop_codon:yes gene_type:complete